MSRLVAASFATAVVVVAACDSSQRGLEGRWEARDADRLSVEFMSDSTFRMDTGSFVGTGRYTVDANRVAMEPTGDLAAVVPAGYTASLAGDTLNLCAPSGVCSNLYRD